MEKDYYEILQVHPKASPIVIKKAYRALLLELGNHPDQGGSAERTRLLNEAYQVLGDPTRRRAYDRTYDPRPRPEVKTAPVYMAMCPRCGVYNRIRSEDRLNVARCGRCRNPLNRPPQKPQRLIVGLALAAVVLSLVAWILVPARESETVSRGISKASGDHLRLGQIYEEQRQLGKALSEYRQASEEDPKAAYPHFLLGRTLLALDRVGEAVPQLKAAVALDASDAAARMALGNAYLERNDPKNAVPQLQKALDLAPSAESATLLGMAYLEDHQYDRARGSFQRAIALDHRYRPALIRLGDIYRGEGKLKEALTFLERAVALCGEDPELHYLLAEIHRQLGNREKAVQELEICLGQAKNPILAERAQRALREIK